MVEGNIQKDEEGNITVKGGIFKVGWDGSITSTWGTIGGFTITDHSIFSGVTVKDYEEARGISVWDAKTYWGQSHIFTTSIGADGNSVTTETISGSTYDFRLGNSLIYKGNLSGANSRGRMYLASNLYSFKANDSNISSHDDLKDDSYFIYGINYSNNLQIGSISG